MSFRQFISDIQNLKMKVEVPFLWVVLGLGLVPSFPRWQKYTAILVPPIRTQSTVICASYLGAVLLAIYICFQWPEWPKRPWFKKMCIVAIASLLTIQLGLWIGFVHTQEIPDKDPPLTVLVGFVKKPETVAIYPDKNDSQIVDDEGAYEEKVDLLWTRKSVILSRLLAISVYSLLGFMFTALLATLTPGSKGAVELPEVELPDS